MIKAALVIAIVIAWHATPAAQGRTDVVRLLNGDRITGEVEALERGQLEFKTDDAGTIAIEWDNVIGLASTRGFEIETGSGVRVFGFLSAASDRALTVDTPGGPVALDMADVTRITPIGASFWTRIDGSFDAGFTYSQSSGIAQATLNSMSVFRRPLFEVRLDGSATVTQTEGEDGRDDRGSIDLSYVRYRGARWLVSGAARFESNTSLGLTLRSQVGGMIGQRLVNSNRAQFEAGGGLVVNDERSVDSGETQNIEGVLGFESSYYTYDRPKTQFDTSLHYYPSLSNWGRQRLQFDTAIKRELWKDFFVSLNGYDTFDSDPPQAGSARNDVGVSFSIGWSY